MVTIKNRVDPEGDGPDPAELVRKAIAANLDTSVFTEHAWDVAKNSIEWCTSHRFLHASDPLWPRQFEVLARFFGDVCYLCSDVDYVHNVPVDDSMQNVQDRFALLEHGICPRCRRNRIEMLDDWIKDPRYGKYNTWDASVKLRPVPPNEFTGIWGQRSGKSFTVATFFWTYIIHRYLSLPSITNYFRLASNTMLEATMVAPIKDQINTYMWTPFKNACDGSPWFGEYVRYLKSEEKRLGVPMYMRQQTYIGFPSKRLLLTMKAANSSTLRGGTRAICSLDELGWFNCTESGKQRAGVKDGVEIFTSLNRSLRSIRSRANKRRRLLGDYDAVDGYMFNISSPSSIADAIEQRAAIATKSPRMYFIRHATWEVNPEEDEETIREEEGSDLVKFTRDYCAQPPRAASPFLPASPLLKELAEPSTKHQLMPYTVETAEDEGLGITLLRPTLGRRTQDKQTPRAIAVDVGEKKNAFAVGIGRYFPEHDGVLLEDFCEVAPEPNRQVDLQWCYDEFITQLVRSYNILHVAFDRWESGYAVRDLRTTFNIDAQRITLAWRDFDEFRDAIRASRLWFPLPEVDPDSLVLVNNLAERAKYPRADFQVQLTTVNQFGKKVTKPDGGNDDVFRCAVLLHHVIMSNVKDYQRGTRRAGHGSRVFSTAGRRPMGHRPARGFGMQGMARFPRRGRR